MELRPGLSRDLCTAESSFAWSVFQARAPKAISASIFANVTEEQAAALKLKDVHGVEITGVDHDAPACKAGLEVHDVILPG